ncbi:hypothetical protein L9F63_003910, partial [Diploptera punctata]
YLKKTVLNHLFLKISAPAMFVLKRSKRTFIQALEPEHKTTGHSIGLFCLTGMHEAKVLKHDSHIILSSTASQRTLSSMLSGLIRIYFDYGTLQSFVLPRVSRESSL